MSGPSTVRFSRIDIGLRPNADIGVPLPLIEVARKLPGATVANAGPMKGQPMNDDHDKQRSEADAEVEREIRQGRKFSPNEALARLAGPGAMKGASPVSPVQQAEIEIGSWLRSHVTDPAGALQVVLHRHLKGSELLLNNLEQPLVALAGYSQHVLASDYLLKELVREADVEWGQRMDERPYFQKEGSPQHPGDPYTVESVGRALAGIVEQLAGPTG